MKKIVSLFAVLVILFSMAATPALAAERKYKNVKLYPYDGALCPEGEIDWSCSGTMYVDFALWQWADELLGNPAYYKAVAVKLYKLEEKQGAFGWNGYTTKIEENLIGNLYDKNIKDKDKYEYTFSANGTTNVTEGSYRIKIIATISDGVLSPWTDTIAEHDFTVYSKSSSSSSSSSSSNSSQSKPQYAEVQIIHRLQNGVVLDETRIQSKLGTKYFSPYWSNGNYELTSAHNVKYEVTSGTNIVYFTYKEKNNSSSSSNNNSSNSNSSNNNSSNNNSSNNNSANNNSNRYDPNNPFGGRSQTYDNCLAPEYRVDPEKEPWGYCYLYSEASDINGRNMGKYEKGEVVKVIDYYGGGHGSYNYCYVITQKNKMGYIHDYALKPVNGTTSEYTGNNAQQYRIDPSQKPWNYCYLYDKPSAEDGRNLGRYEKGEVVTVIEYYGGGWYGNDNYCYVRTKDGKTGYMHDYALKPVY